MSDLGALLEQIDTVTGCHHCGGPLGNSPSGDFCGETCQARWHANRSHPLPDPRAVPGVTVTVRVDTSQAEHALIRAHRLAHGEWQAYFRSPRYPDGDPRATQPVPADSSRDGLPPMVMLRAVPRPVEQLLDTEITGEPDFETERYVCRVIDDRTMTAIYDLDGHS